MTPGTMSTKSSKNACKIGESSSSKQPTLPDVTTTKFNVIKNCLVFSLINVQQQYNNIPLWRHEPKPWPWYKGGDLTLMKFAEAFIGTGLQAKTGPRTSIRSASTWVSTRFGSAPLIPDACTGSRTTAGLPLPATFSKFNSNAFDHLGI